MIPKECKRLAEVDFPIAAVSKHSAREKSIRHGHPSTLHLWWARRPLAACRAMLMALLLPDPCDEHCPAEFKRDARIALVGFFARPTRWNDQMKTDEGLRAILLEFIADFANWDNSGNNAYLNTARSLVNAANPEETPLVVDPFAGGGSIPLEALRVGCDSFASDLNPVACLIQKVLLEHIPRHGAELAKELRRAGAEVKATAEKRLADFYPPDPSGARPIAYLWARTIRCESPNCGCEIPLLKSLWLSKRPRNLQALRLTIERAKGPPVVRFEVISPKSGHEVDSGTVSRAKATCPACHKVVDADRVRSQLRDQRGGAAPQFDSNGRRVAGARLIAVVIERVGQTGRLFRIATAKDEIVVNRAHQRLQDHTEGLNRESPTMLSPVPDEALPKSNTLGLRLPNYGVRVWGDMFNARQSLALVTISEAVSAATRNAAADPLRDLLALAVSRTTDYCSANCSLHAGRDVVRNTWARNALPIVWDYYESVPTGEGSGNFDGAIDWVARVAEVTASLRMRPGQTQLADARELPLPDDSTDVWFSDPPYYNAIGYAESADFFFVWLKRLVDYGFMRDPFDSTNVLTPKCRECIQDHTYRADDGMIKDGTFFEQCIGDSFLDARRTIRDSGIGCVVFAHKTTEGWEALLGGLVRAGWVVTASWPIETEMRNKVSGSQAGEQKAMLLASIHLVCRPRPDDARIGDWAEVLRELPARVEAWMNRLEGEGVRGADLVFACVGPALEIFSRYSRVETAEGNTVPLADYLEKVWEVVGRAALNQVLGTAEGRARNGAAGALEEDARLTALFLWTMQATETNSNPGGETDDEPDDDGTDEEDDDDSPKSRGKGKKGFSLIFDVARRFAQPLGIHLEGWEDRIIQTEKGIVRLIPVLDRAKQLFGEEGAGAIADRLEHSPTAAASAQMMLFPEPATAPKVKGRGRGRKRSDVSDGDLDTRREATTLDRVHAAMLLQASGRANALRALLKAEVERGPDFLRLANALSALYPKGSDEKRLVDAMLLAVPR